MIQHFRKRPNWGGAGTFTTAVFYDGTNLSEVASLGAEISVMSGQKPRVRHRSGSLVHLSHDMWVVRDNLGPGALKWAVNTLSTTSMECMYEGPYTRREAEEMQRIEQEADAENALASEDAAPARPKSKVKLPSYYTAEVYGDNLAQMAERAVALARELYGPDVPLRADFSGRSPVKNGGDQSRGKFFCSVPVRVDEEEASSPEANVLHATVRAGDRGDLKAEAVLAGRQFFGLAGALTVDFVNPVRRHQFGDGEAQYEADVRITLHP